ncbi:hypothetical protein ACFFMS_12845 [Ectobacillus funiculus]|uniref:Uncharacterized protein n=1 Tax=Ectobacillus funiculus TaxID=137993 RepID=A0ABV5WG19_9BACI
MKQTLAKIKIRAGYPLTSPYFYTPFMWDEYVYKQNYCGSIDQNK